MPAIQTLGHEIFFSRVQLRRPYNGATAARSQTGRHPPELKEMRLAYKVRARSLYYQGRQQLSSDPK
jgi:hypothetical protein